jgi:hypothetical protein
MGTQSGERNMTLTGFLNRIVDWVYRLEWRDELVWLHQELNERLEHYDYALRGHLRNGGSINRNHDWAFRFIVRQSLTEIEERLDVLNILESA